MAEGCLRSDFLCMSAGTELRVPNFARLLDDAVISARSTEDAEIVASTRSREDVARSALDDLEAFRSIAAGYGFTPIMVELAIFNDELLQIAMDPSDRVVSNHSGGSSDLPEFLSVSASYEDFTENSALLRAWHRASRLVVERDKESTVGEKRTYDYAYLWDYLAPQEIKSASADARRFEGQQEPSAAFVIDGLANVMPPVSYSLGTEAIRRIKEDFSIAKSRTARLDEVLKREPRRILHNLMTYFAAAAYYEKSDAVIFALAKTILLVVPFTRPWLFRMEDPSKHKEEPPTSRPGGGVFMILKVDEELMANKHSLEASLTRLSSALDYVVFQAGMLEAQQQRFMTRETDLSLFGHTISGQLRQATTDCSRAVFEASKSLGGDSRVMTYINSVYQSVLRLEQVSEIARTVVLMRSGRAAPTRFSSRAVFADFESEVVTCCRMALANAREGISDPARKLAVQNVTYEPLQWPKEAPSLVKTDDKYLTMLINELMRNAVRHGDFDDRQQIEFQFTCKDKYVHLEVRNPIRIDAKTRQTLNNMLSRKSLSLGITQIEILARTYGLPLPCFSVLTKDFSVECVVAEKIMTGPSPGWEGVQ